MKKAHSPRYNSNNFNGTEGQSSGDYAGWANAKQNTSPNSKDSVFRCSQCGSTFRQSNSPCLPFCSIRCQRIDLGNWLNESYGLPIESQEERGFGTIDKDDDQNEGWD